MCVKSSSKVSIEGHRSSARNDPQVGKSDLTK